MAIVIPDFFSNFLALSGRIGAEKMAGLATPERNHNPLLEAPQRMENTRASHTGKCGEVWRFEPKTLSSVFCGFGEINLYQITHVRVGCRNSR
jgi:hypothetical protein